MSFPDLAEICRALKLWVKKTPCLFCLHRHSPTSLRSKSYSNKVKVVSNKQDLAQLDLYILSQSDHFVGNCVLLFLLLSNETVMSMPGRRLSSGMD
ncbi:GDP-fucose protein O-fucosyltransferase 1-like [Salmo trutta]|uniref:GDP-fucose protein O-fucosyltransferase 1-like n=1 Tax=Salmo trutta TaxID=8032 RepID=UPI00113107D5|nr:GDP-fucose protein O-fucosyltransferase 1-like [Salmo trutta]